MSTDRKALVSAARDGTIVVRSFDYTNAVRTFTGELFINYTVNIIKYFKNFNKYYKIFFQH